MSLFLKQEDSRSELQKKIALDLQEKLKNQPKATDMPDGVEDSRYVEGYKKTTSLSWVWALIIIAIVALIIRFTFIGMSS